MNYSSQTRHVNVNMPQPPAQINHKWHVGSVYLVTIQYDAAIVCQFIPQSSVYGMKASSSSFEPNCLLWSGKVNLKHS